MLGIYYLNAEENMTSLTPKELSFKRIQGVPDFRSISFKDKASDFILLIPIINEGDRLIKELRRAQNSGISKLVDIVLCDKGSTDGSVEYTRLIELGVSSMLVKKDIGGQGAQLRMGIWWAFEKEYKGIITMDGNNKDSIEDIPKFIKKLRDKYDFVQGSRFIKGGKAIRTPLLRLVATRLIHAPIISLTAKFHFTDTTNAFRAYSIDYLRDSRVKPLRDCFQTYELLAYLSVRASQLGMRVCEIPVERVYPSSGKVPTKISLFKGNFELLKILFYNVIGKYNP